MNQVNCTAYHGDRKVEVQCAVLIAPYRAVIWRALLGQARKYLNMDTLQFALSE